MARKVVQGQVVREPGAELELGGPGPMYRPGGRARCPRCGLADRPRRRVLVWLRRELCDRCQADRDHLAGQIIGATFGLLLAASYAQHAARAAELERIIGRPADG